MHSSDASGFKIQQAKTTRLFQADTSLSQTFVRDGAYITNPVLRDSTSSYTPGISSRTGGSSTFSHSNIKNAEIQTDSNANWSGMRLYDAFGNIRYSQGWTGPFGYAGGAGYQEDATGLKLLGHRYYDPSTGRFLTRDPIKDGRNYYAYCNSNPISMVDKSGLAPVPNLGGLFIDSDGDGIPNILDDDVDDDGWINPFPGPGDIESPDIDTDGDGINDAEDLYPYFPGGESHRRPVPLPEKPKPGKKPGLKWPGLWEIIIGIFAPELIPVIGGSVKIIPSDGGVKIKPKPFPFWLPGVFIPLRSREQ